jgi:predicted transposase YdaD
VAKPFDATLKELVETYPGDWLSQLGLSALGPVDLIDADLSTVTTQADKIIRVLDPEPWLLHLDLQAGRDPHVDRRALKYNVLAHDRHDLPVESVIVLLRPEADASHLTGSYRYQPARGQSSVEFHYQLVRLWQRPVDTVLTGGVGTLPLAPLCAVRQEALPAVIRRMDQRFREETAPAEAATLWTSTYVLMGLRYPLEVAMQLLKGVRDMKESVTYQAILEEGEMRGVITEARKLLLLLGTTRFGPPDAPTRDRIESINDVQRLEQLTVRLLDVSNWDELLASS